MNPSVEEVYSVPPTSPDRPFPPVVRSHAVSEVTPAKKITFFRSGDPQFSGVKMAINRRSFKSFSALMDDLSNKVPLPFGVRTITTPRGTHNISRLEQLQDGGSYICSDKKYVLPIAGRKVGNQRVSRPISARKQGQHGDPEEEYSAAHFQQVPKVRKKVVLVKNGDPTFRRSMLLNRRNARNFRTFLEDASDLLQYTVRRLYTVDGRRIENIQAVLQSSSILICAGKEPFKPIQMENIQKSVTEKLPGLRSHPSNNTEIMDNKKNANFGPKAKKSIIHPRPASSNKTRLSLSSEKSYPNGLNMSPVNSGFGSYPNMCPHGKSEDANHSLLNDDIEKKVHVNKDGSLSVEMKVRFRLLNEETLQWSTQIKKSSTIGKTKCEQLCLFDESDKKEEMNTENFSETDESFYPCDADSYTSKLNEVGIDDMYCSHCGMQCQEYDIWKNPMHANQQEDYVKRATWQTRSSTSSTSSRHRVKGDQKTSVDSLHSMSSEEYTEHILHRSSRYSETKENGDTMVTYSTVSQCASRSGRSTVASNTDAISDTEQRKRSRSQNKSSSSLKSQSSMQKQPSPPSEEQHRQTHHGGSFEECPKASPTPCSGSQNCSRRASVVSQSSLHSRKSHMLKRNSTNTKSFASNPSCNEEEDTQQPSCKGSPKNMQGISVETANSEDPCVSPPAEDCSHDNEIHAKHATENTLSTDPTKCSLADYDKSSVGTTSRSSNKSRSSSKKSMKVNGHDEDDTSCNSQKSESVLIKRESSDVCENSVSESNGILTPSKSKSFTERKGQSFRSTRSCQSKSSITESVQLNHIEDEHPILNQQESCNESSSCTEKPDPIACIVNEDGENSLPNSRASSKSLSSKFNSTSCQENEQVFNVSSRVSSISEKSLVKSSSSRDSTREMSQEEEAVKDNGAADSSSQTVAPDMSCTHSPSPPEGKPTHKHVRSAQFKISSNSISSDQMKTMNGEKSDNSRASTPGSKGMLASMETNKKTKNVVTSHNSTENFQSTKKHKNSSSSSKKKHKGDSLDADNNINNELVPSALPNVTPEEVVNEWLRKIPSPTMVVEYEVDECQKNPQAEMGIDASKTAQEEGDLPKEPITEENNTDETKDEISEDVQCVNIVNDLQDTNIADVNDNEESVILSKVSGNNIKNEGIPNDKKSLPNNIQTSVQIMKALLSHSQESKFDRSNSLPEVSITMGRKLSNSAAVLISCLASLQLLDEGQAEIINNTKDLKKPKYIELLNILQALWAEDPTNKSIINIKSGKQYSTDEEITPVSSSGVDLNSGFEGSGDGSITGGGDHIVTTGKPEDGKLSILVKEIECTDKNMKCCQQTDFVSGEHDVASGEENTNEVEVASFNEDKSCIMDENMNEKKLDSSDNTSETEIKEETKEEGHYNAVNNVNDVECMEEMEEHRVSNNENMNILSHSEEPKFNESNSPETNNINSPTDCPSTVISTSDSNGKNEDKQGHEADPVWVLNLLKKIEREFMTHYVDAMHEFKVRWNLEDNENLDEMIAELKNEVSLRIQKSISNELMKINARAGKKVPRPPVEGRRRSSLQAEERRRRLQTMHRVSIRQYANGGNRVVGSYDFSSETNEEDLTFSASLGEDSFGQPNDEFCPCEKCIMQKRALRLSNPQTVAANAPIIKAFDLQQILKMKQNNDTKNDESGLAVLPNKETEPSMVDDGSDYNEEATNDEDGLSKAGKGIDKEKSDMSSEDGDVNSQEVKSVMDEYEASDSNDFQSNTACQEKEPEESENKGPDEETKPIENLEADLENSNSDVLENNSELLQNGCMECPDENTSACEETGNNDEEHISESLAADQQLVSNQEEISETEEHEDELNKTDEVQMATEVSENEDHLVENETTSPDINTEEDVENENENTEAVENKGSRKRKPFVSCGSLITQNGSADDNEIQYKTNHNIGEIAEDTETECQENHKTGEPAEDAETECQENQNTGETGEDPETECQENHNTEEPAEDPETECQENQNTEEPAEDAETECQETHNIEEPAEDPETECQENQNTGETGEDPETECQENHNTEEPAEDPETECQETHNTEEPAEDQETECQETHNTEEPVEDPETECQENHNTEEPAEDPETECQENHNTEEPAEDQETECQETHNTEEPAEDPETECQENHNTEEPAEDQETECQETHNTEEPAEDPETECQENHNTEEPAEDLETEGQENHNTGETAEDLETECQENHNTEETAEDTEIECQENHNTEEPAEDPETECQENHNTGETSPNGQSNGSGSKKSQMYPESSSENEDGDSPRDSPVGVLKKKNIGKVYANNKESFEECENNSKKDLDEDIIDQDEFDF